MLNKSDTESYPTPQHGSFDFKVINANDPRIWAAFSRGDTFSVFQLEKSLGQTWSKLVKPQNIQELACLISILRPGCLENSISAAYAKRKNGQEQVTYLHPSLEPILKETYGVIIFQESILRIGIEIAGMSQEDADFYLRKGVGKKDVKIITECHQVFLDGCKKKGIVDEKIAEELFEIIKKFQRYGFNKCVTLDTIVETKDGFKTIKDLNIGEKVFSPYGFIDVIDKIDTGFKEVYEVTLESGKTIKCTMDHKFLCENDQIHTLWDILTNDYKIVCEEN